MKFIVIIKVGGEEGMPMGKWPPQTINAEDRWGALVKAVEVLGIEERFPMRYLWKKASIVKEKKKSIRRFRVKEESIGRG